MCIRDSVYSAEVPTNPSEGGEAVYSRIEGAIREALASDPDRKVCLLYTSTALDVTVQKQVIKLLNDLQAKLGFAMIFVSHDLAPVSYTHLVPGVPAEVARSVFESLRALEAQRVEQDASEGE